MTGPPASPRVITFYSYKGGTGRSMALANVAWILASNGKRVLVLDWDLEAPGLHRYFHPFLRDRELTSSEGIIDFVMNYAREAVRVSEKTPRDWYLPFANILRVPRRSATRSNPGRLTSSPRAGRARIMPPA
jgi:cellulose biosynthesis protein BcsQ